jgi:uncharacterized protein (DUF952 family)
MRAIYKICRAAEWEEAERSGAFEGSDVDRRDGFIHFSTAEQVAETAAKYYSNIDDLKLVAVGADTLAPALKWEPARGGDLFPHLYGKLPMAAVLWVRPLPLDAAGRHVFPSSRDRRVDNS